MKWALIWVVFVYSGGMGAVAVDTHSQEFVGKENCERAKEILHSLNIDEYKVNTVKAVCVRVEPKDLLGRE